MANKVLSNEKNKKTSEKISDFMLKNRLVIMAASLVIIIAALAVSIVSVVSSSSSKKELSAIDAIDGKLKAVDEARAKLGASQNRLESTIRNQSSISENLSNHHHLRIMHNIVKI